MSKVKADTKRGKSGDRAESKTKVEQKVQRRYVTRGGKRVEVNSSPVRETR